MQQLQDNMTTVSGSTPELRLSPLERRENSQSLRLLDQVNTTMKLQIT